VAATGFEPVTKGKRVGSQFTGELEESYNNGMANIKSLLNQIAKLTPEERQLLFSLAQGKASTLNSPAEGLEDWENDMSDRGLASGTISMYLKTVGRFLEAYPMPTARDIRAYFAQRKLTRYDGRPGGISPTKIRNDQKALRSFFNFLESEGLWLDNPAKGLRLTKTAKVIREAPESENVHKLLEAWTNSPQRLEEQVLITLFIDTGLRIREACSIKMENLRLERAEVKVLGKGNKERIVPLSPVTVKLIQTYLDKNLHLRSGEYLFATGSKQGYKSTHNLERTFRRLCKRLGIPKITPHQLRHYFATYALKNGAKLEVISKILGHSSVAITADVYRHVKQDEIQQEHAKYSPLANTQ
jgi:site-specific recombinase XerD